MADDTPSPETNAVTFKSGEVEVPLDLVARAFGLAPEIALEEMRAGRITSVMEKGTDADEGRYRLTFFHGSMRARFVVDESGAVLQRSSVEFGASSKRT
jgi:5-hydroxyisourate hydrolase-like protein (transthyretin family)